MVTTKKANESGLWNRIRGVLVASVLVILGAVIFVYSTSLTSLQRDAAAQPAERQLEDFVGHSYGKPTGRRLRAPM